MIGERRRSISSNASSQVASTSSPSRRTSGVVRRSGSSWSCLIPYAFGQRKPRLKTSSASPRTDTTSRPSVSISSPQVASQNGQVRKWIAIRGPYCRSPTPAALCPQLDPQRARGAGEHALRVVQSRGGPVLAPILAERPREDRVPLPGPYRAAEPRGQAREHHRRPLAEVRDRRAGRAVERAPDELRPDPTFAVRRRCVRRPAGAEQAVPARQTRGEDPETVLARGPADHAR